MQAMLYGGGAFHLALAVFHLGFWRLFRWREELPRLGYINRQVVQILNLCLTFVFLGFAWISFMHTDALLGTPLGRTLLTAIALFWLLRAAWQVAFFGMRRPVSVVFLLLFLAGAALYALPLVLA